VLSGVTGVRAVWLGGSFASGDADAYSDVDIHCLVDDAGTFDGDGWKPILEAISPTVAANQIPNSRVVVFAITPEWEHIDLAFFERPSAGPKLALFDPDDLLHDIAADPSPAAPWTRQHVEMFLYILGNLVTVVGRGEYATASFGSLLLMHTHLVPLMLAARGIAQRGGLKRLSSWLTNDEIAVVNAMPAQDATRDAVVAGHIYVARHYLPLARSVTQNYPHAYEQATLRYLETHLGITAQLLA
jgi:hypothetical protein